MKDWVEAEYVTRVHVQYCQYYVGDRDQDAVMKSSEETTGLADLTGGGGIRVLTGTHTGSIGLTVLLLEASPPQFELDAWDDIVDVGYQTPDGTAQVQSWPDAPLPGRLIISHTGPGGYRLRFHARGRDDPRNQNPYTTVEEHLIAVWPEQFSPATTVHKTTDECGKRRRDAAQRRK